MSIGTVIFAQNNTGIDYIKLATFTAQRVQKFLEIPVSVVTDTADLIPSGIFDQIIEIPTENCSHRPFHDGMMTSKSFEWKNVSRNQVYNLTPYDTTLVIDSDFIISSDRLKQAFSRDVLFQIYKTSVDLCDWRDTLSYKRINQYSVPFYWATTFVFQKHPIVEAFFDLVSYIKHNWLYFKTLYSIDSEIFRNDYAFSIAIHIMNGKTNGEFTTDLPGNMCYILEQDFLIDIKDSAMSFLIQKQNRKGEYLAVKTSDIDVHVMNKHSLSRFIDGGSGV